MSGFRCLSAAVDDVPEEPQVEQEPEEPKELKDASTQESIVEPVKEPVRAPTSPPVEPVQTAASVPLAAGSVRNSVEPAEPETENLNDRGSGQMKNETEEEEKEARKPVKEGNICEHQEGMSTQQVQHELNKQLLLIYLYLLFLLKM